MKTISYEESREENNFGIPASVPTVRIRYRVALDNHEPTRHFLSGIIVRYSREFAGIDGYGYVLSLDRAPQLRNPDRCVYLLDDGQSVIPCYVAAYADQTRQPSILYPEGLESRLILHPFPLSRGTRLHRLPGGDGRPMDAGSWMIGPRRCYHLKITPES